MTDRHFSLQWHITNRCDQRCKHCYIYAGNNNECVTKELKWDELQTVLENFDDMVKKMNIRGCIALTGGDPILHPDFWKLLSAIKKRGIAVQILGNPFHINEDVAKRLYDNGCRMYQMSLDGLRYTHDAIRKIGSFDETMKKIGILNAAGIKTNIMTTVSRINVDDIPSIVDLIKDKVYAFTFARYCPNEGDADMMLSPDRYREFLSEMWKKYEECSDSSTRFILKDHLWKLFLYENGLYDIRDFNRDNIVMDGCHCGIAHMTVLENGDVYACRRCSSLVGNALKDSLYDIFLGDRMEKYRQFSKFDKCSKCELLYVCRGCLAVSKCATGDFYGIDPQCWKKI